ncbi:pyridoxamine 5'-phosphate oxidase family protein [Halorientalis regularis]|uniref:Pyridoxamine 5'-phosphate oxidase n=1 Tax=Halorientalis regularis TaxID=660518 RepID=A0A1G7PKF2_9EURY|nr:pyridoxamine 5'-phosphate oxidase family protein [Halorientalis regularis]SDF86852.1 Pyridoxamine 5'-phosphate oxidase [Halorientalis regularis]
MASVPDEAEDLLTSEPLVAHLATCRDGRPHAAPLWYLYRDGLIEIATTGEKLENIRHNPAVALSIQKAEDGDPQWGMTVRGTADVIKSESERITQRLNEKYGAEEDAWQENTGVRIEIGSVDYWTY